MSIFSVGPGTFTCTHADSKTSYCVGDVITYSLAISGSNWTTFNHPEFGPSLIDCQVRGAGASGGEGGKTRSADRRGFLWSLLSIRQRKELTGFLE